MLYQEIFAQLEADLGSMPGFQAVFDRLQQRFAGDEDFGWLTLAYWCDESLYFLMAWQKKHEQAGEEEKAMEEGQQIAVVQKMLELAKPHLPTQVMPEQSGSL